MNSNINIFYTTCSNIAESRKLANHLLSYNKVVCVNIIKNVESLYKDNGEIKKSRELILIVKAMLNKNQIENLIKSIHPYETPFIIKFETKKVNDEYLKWAKINL